METPNICAAEEQTTKCRSACTPGQTAASFQVATLVLRRDPVIFWHSEGMPEIILCRMLVSIVVFWAPMLIQEAAWEPIWRQPGSPYTSGASLRVSFSSPPGASTSPGSASRASCSCVGPLFARLLLVRICIMYYDICLYVYTCTHTNLFIHVGIQQITCHKRNCVFQIVILNVSYVHEVSLELKKTFQKQKPKKDYSSPNCSLQESLLLNGLGFSGVLVDLMKSLFTSPAPCTSTFLKALGRVAVCWL